MKECLAPGSIIALDPIPVLCAGTKNTTLTLVNRHEIVHYSSECQLKLKKYSNAFHPAHKVLASMRLSFALVCRENPASERLLAIGACYALGGTCHEEPRLMLSSVD